ncbi:hypothetical protein FXO37_32811 [Capsicum annuum]|nr:hypothetical protein FXO37_32811 [Capsicum annuum]
MPPVGDKPSLMTFLEVETVFHEFGHALQHMLTKQDEGLVAGLRGIERDARELPSQFMENWCYHSDIVEEVHVSFALNQSAVDYSIIDGCCRNTLMSMMAAAGIL